MRFRGDDGAGLQIAMDAAVEAGGHGDGPSPVKVLAMALGGCTGMDVISMLRKMRQVVTGYDVRVTGPRTEEHPRIYTTLTVEHVVRGRNLAPASVRRAVELSATRYCPVSAMLGKAVSVTHRYRVLDDSGVEMHAGVIE